MNAALFPDLVVNGEMVPHAAVAAEAQNQSPPKGKPGIAWRKAASAMAVRTLLVQEAHRRGLTPEPEQIAQGQFETEEEALIRGLLETAFEVPAPSAAAVRAEWARDPARFRAPPLWEVSHILIACDPRNEAERDAAQTRALALAGRALAAPDGFARLARDASDCPSKANGGALGQLGPGDTVPEFEAALRQLADGQVTPEPVLTRHGWHVIRMDAVAKGAVLPFETVRQKVAEAMEKAGWAEAARQFVEDLVADADIRGAQLGPMKTA